MCLGRGGDSEVSVLAFHSSDPGSNLTEVHTYICKMLSRKNNKRDIFS